MRTCCQLYPQEKRMHELTFGHPRCRLRNLFISHCLTIPRSVKPRSSFCSSMIICSLMRGIAAPLSIRSWFCFRSIGAFLSSPPHILFQVSSLQSRRRLTDRNRDDKVWDVVHESTESSKDVSVQHAGKCFLTVWR